jgi:hypothetical protein
LHAGHAEKRIGRQYRRGVPGRPEYGRGAPRGRRQVFEAESLALVLTRIGIAAEKLGQATLYFNQPSRLAIWKGSQRSDKAPLLHIHNVIIANPEQRSIRFADLDILHLVFVIAVPRIRADAPYLRLDLREFL